MLRFSGLIANMFPLALPLKLRLMLFHSLVLLLNFVLTFAFRPAVLLMKTFTVHVVFVLRCRFHPASALLFNRKLPNGNGAAVLLLHTAATANKDDHKIYLPETDS